MERVWNSRRFYRFLEMIPGLLSWNVILFLVWGSLLIPRVVAYFVIAFLIFWLYQSFKSAILSIQGFWQIKKAQKINWRQRYLSEKKDQKGWLSWKKIKHIIIIPTYKEPLSVLSKNLDCLSGQKGVSFEKLTVVLAMEKRDPNCRLIAEEVVEKYQNRFGRLVVTYHPPDITGEIKGKASNEAWAAKEIKKILIDREGGDINYFTITSSDADTCFHPKHFSALSYYFAKNRKRYLRFWQSPILFYNNLDRVPAPVRIVSIIGNIIHIGQLKDPSGLLFNQSSYSLSLKLLDEAGYWDTDIIPEDWHLFLQAFFAKEGKVGVVPIFLPTNMDAPEGKTPFEAIKNRYLQCQRHAWGATDIPYTIIQAKKHPEIPLVLRLLRIYKLLEAHFIWSTNWFILSLGASLPPILNPKFFQTSFGYNLPKFSQTILTVCLLALLVIIVLDWKLDPKKNKGLSFFKKIIYLIQWFLMPVATLFMSVLPGLHAQTKLLFGKRLEYLVTKKY
ncbi:MAG: glycosyltransferase family 2 protein [Patescibacteria group bacterium]